MFLIEYDIPILDPIRGGGNSNKQYPFDDMIVGSSFFVPGMMGRNGLTAAIWRAKRDLPGRSFIIRSWNNGHRCWRVK